MGLSGKKGDAPGLLSGKCNQHNNRQNVCVTCTCKIFVLFALSSSCCLCPLHHEVGVMAVAPSSLAGNNVLHMLSRRTWGDFGEHNWRIYEERLHAFERV